jgi:protein-disulfide isomerase
MKNYLIITLLLSAVTLLPSKAAQESPFTNPKPNFAQDPEYIAKESPRNAYNTLIFNVDQRQTIDTKNELKTQQVAENPVSVPQKKSGYTKIITIILGGVVIAGGVAIKTIEVIIENSLSGI